MSWRVSDGNLFAELKCVGRICCDKEVEGQGLNIGYFMMALYRTTDAFDFGSLQLPSQKVQFLVRTK